MRKIETRTNLSRASAFPVDRPEVDMPWDPKRKPAWASESWRRGSHNITRALRLTGADGRRCIVAGITLGTFKRPVGLTVKRTTTETGAVCTPSL